MMGTSRAIRLIACSVLGLAAFAAGTDVRAQESVQLRFLSLAWQPDAVTANHEIVDAWNEANPDIEVEYVQGDWGSVNDELVTAFEGGTPPDVFHEASADLNAYVDRGYLLDLGPLLSDEFKASITDEAWETVMFDDGIYGVPFLQESAVLFANTAMLEEAGVTPPTIDDPWTWDEFTEAAAQMTADDGSQFGTVWTLGSPTRQVLNLAMTFDGHFFSGEGEDVEVVFGEGERTAVEFLHDQMYGSGVADPAGVSMGSTDVLPGFFAGKYGMFLDGAFFRSQILEAAPDDFEWATLMPPVGTSAEHSNESQTLSVPATAEHPEEAAQFIEFFLNVENQARLAAGDWLLPTSPEAWDQPELDTTENGWDVVRATADDLVPAAFQTVVAFDEWRTRVADPAFQQYFANEIDIDELETQLVDEGNAIVSR